MMVSNGISKLDRLPEAPSLSLPTARARKPWGFRALSFTCFKASCIQEAQRPAEASAPQITRGVRLPTIRPA